MSAVQTPPSGPTPPPPPPIEAMDASAIESMIEMLKKELMTVDQYLVKLLLDRTNLQQTMIYYQDNIRYMRKHEGTISMDHYRRLKVNLKKNILLTKENDNAIDKFDKAKTNTNKKIDMLTMDLSKKKWAENHKIIPFKRRIENDNQS